MRYQKAIIKEIQLFVNRTKSKKSIVENRPITQEETNLMIDSSLIKIYLMLVGYAVENLLKGILILQNPSYIKSNLILDPFISKHTLLTFSKKINLNLTPKEEDILKTLEIFINLKGRYNVPKKASDLYPIRNHKGEPVQPGQSSTNESMNKVIEEIYIKIINIYNKEK